MNKKILVSILSIILVLSAASFAADSINTPAANQEKTQIRLQNKEQKQTQVKANIQKKRKAKELHKNSIKDAVQQKQQIKAQTRERLKDGTCTGDSVKLQKQKTIGNKVKNNAKRAGKTK